MHGARDKTGDLLQLGRTRYEALTLMQYYKNHKLYEKIARKRWPIMASPQNDGFAR